MFLNSNKTMKIINKLFGLIILLTMFACQSGSDSFGLSKETSFEIGVQDYDGILTDEDSELNFNSERKLITTGGISFETDDIVLSRTNIIEAVKKYNAYISSEREYKSSSRLNNTIIIRVPAQNFNKLLDKVSEGVKKLDSKQIEVQDVTEQFLDVQARLKTKKELELRYLELLKKANTVSEILEIEKELGTLRSDIESTEGKLKYLKNQIGFSTLTITFYEEIASQTAFGKQFKEGFKNGWENLILFFVALTNIWTFILLFIGLIFIFRFWKKNRKNKPNK